jgi:hypothetical protein
MTDNEPFILLHSNLFHTGVVVDDLAAAKEEYGESLGLTWRSGGAKVRLVTDEGSRTVRSAYALSREGPHHVELVQSVEGTLWTAGASGRAHHLGYWVNNVAAASEALIRHGAAKMASVAMADDAPPICAYHLTRHGLCVEVVDLAMRPVLLPTE